MKKLKDFIYDKNDIIIAILILAAATLVIFWRLSVILEYPKQLLGNDEPSVETPVDNTDDETGSQTDDEKDPSDDAENLPLWQDGALTKDVEVKVTGSSASAAIQCLIDEGLFEDYSCILC